MPPNAATTESLYELIQPEPSALLESLRAFGYSLHTAIADLIDNSIAAKAKNIWVNFEWKGSDSYIIIKDDGEGMTEKALIKAMCPGSQSPLESRLPKDLGRFGLGLKTASFSQCRQLTVASKAKNNIPAIRCWDLDYISKTKEWRLLKTVQPEPPLLLIENLSEHGTLILWQKMDRVTGFSQSDDEKAYQRFLEAIDKVKLHVGMVFHRYLERPSGLKIWINNRPINPWNPFLRNETATQELPVEKLICGDKEIIIFPCVLPHHSKISRETYQQAAGPGGWNAQQGFYVYRNERLLVGGSWLGLDFRKEEHYKLVRIQIDLPNSMDEEWHIDVKKSRAKIPGYLRPDLKRIALLTRQQALDIYRHRGKVVARQNSKSFVFLWEQKIRHGKIFYAINRDHPLVQCAYHSGKKIDLDALISMLEETFPVFHILMTNISEPEKLCYPYENAPPELLQQALHANFTALLDLGFSVENAKKHLLGIDPFDQFPDYVNAYLSRIIREKE